MSQSTAARSINQHQEHEQLTTFYVGKDLFGIEVMKVQEVTGNPQVVPVPLAPSFVCGLINLRGQIATALGLRELFLTPTEAPSERMSVVCKLDGNMVSLIVDHIGDVVEVNKDGFESTPSTIPPSVKRFVKGIYKLNGVLLSLIDLEALAKELSPNLDSATERIN